MSVRTEAPQFSVVVPVYNSGPGLSELVRRLRKVFADAITANVEIILVNDGSPSAETRTRVDQLSAEPDVMGIHLTRNFGKAGALTCGFHHARGDWIVTIDDDLQQRPEDIARLAELREHDVVVGTHTRKAHTLGQRLTSRVKSAFDRQILGLRFRIGPLMMIQRPILVAMLQTAQNRPFIPALIRDVTTDMVAVELDHAPSAYGRSRFGFFKRFGQFSNLIIGNSALLMHSIAITGLAVMAASLLLAAAIIMRKLSGGTVEAGWSSLMVAILLLGGLNLGATGLAGEYFIRLLAITSRKPAYVVREVRGGSRPEQPGQSSDGA